MTAMRETSIDSPATWRAETLLDNDGLVKLDANCQAEIDRAAAELAVNPLPVEVLKVSDVEMPSCQATMARVRVQLEDGIGFAVVDRLPVERFDRDISRKLYWLLMSMTGRPVAQAWTGTMVYDVLDTGKKSTAGSGIRSSKTNGGQSYHCDNTFNLPPDFVGLLCLQTAKKGGTSGLISLETVYNLLLEEFPEYLPRLYQPFYYDRQGEHAPDDLRWSYKPVFESDGDRINAYFNPRRVEHGYEMRGLEMDDETRRAINALQRVSERSGLGKDFIFERGQIQIVNNKRLAHRRTAFRDWPEPERRRHLVRMWLRDAGRPFYMG
ncbi:MAG: TauD/TfdA family dioxygenase [Pseudomonadota bacterium]|nr:TauD/TfdA family dioxygenase [Pseudomonadota bacterium]